MAIEIKSLETCKKILSEQISKNLKTYNNSDFEKNSYNKLANLVNDIMMLKKQIEEGADSWKKNQKLIYGN